MFQKLFCMSLLDSIIYNCQYNKNRGKPEVHSDLLKRFGIAGSVQISNTLNLSGIETTQSGLLGENGIAAVLGRQARG